MTKLIAHRGISAVSPENTMDAFTLAWAYDCDGITLDIQITKDHRIIVFRDENLKRITSLDKNVADMDWEDLRNIDVGSHKDGKYGGERIPLLPQVIKLMPTDKILQIEFSEHFKNIQDFIDFIPQIRKDIKLYIASKDLELLVQLKRQFPDLNLLWIINNEQNIDDAINQSVQNQLQGLSLPYPLIKEATVIEKCQNKKLILAARAVNNYDLKNQLAAMNVDIIMSENPHELMGN